MFASALEVILRYNKNFMLPNWCKYIFFHQLAELKLTRRLFRLNASWH